MDLPPNPASPSPPLSAPHSRRSAQAALAVFLVVFLGLLAFRGYGVGLKARPTDPRASGPSAVDLNAAGPAELAQLPGVGPKLAQAIDDHRRVKGPFRSVEELQSVGGIGPATVEKLRPYVRVDVAAAAPDSRLPEPEPLALEPRRPITPASPQLPRPATRGLAKLQSGDPPININTATMDELQRLPGVGPVMARNIIDGRPYSTVEMLDKVKGIGPKTLDKLRPFVLLK